MHKFSLFLLLIEVGVCVCVCAHFKRFHEGTLLRGRKCVRVCPCFCVCVCMAEVLIFFVSGAQMQGPSSSTSPDSAVCIGLWEAGTRCKWGFLGGGCRWLCY